MSKEKFTPGPWFADRIPMRSDDYTYDSFGVFDNDGKVIMDATNSEVACIEMEGPDEEGHVDRWDEQARRNAHLIAAAPELYDALATAEEALAIIYGVHGDESAQVILRQVQSALIKARGE